MKIDRFINKEVLILNKGEEQMGVSKMWKEIIRAFLEKVYKTYLSTSEQRKRTVHTIICITVLIILIRTLIGVA